MSIETYQEREIESLKKVIAQQQERIEALEAALGIIAMTNMSVPQAEWPQHYYQRQLYAAKDAAIEVLDEEPSP